MKAAQLLELAQKFAADPDNIENGLVNYDFVGSDIYLHVAALNGNGASVWGPKAMASSNLDPRMVEEALVMAKALAA